MPKDITNSNEFPPKRIVELVERYLSVNTHYEQRKDEINKETQNQIEKYLEERRAGAGTPPFDPIELLQHIDEFVDHLITYYAYYRNERRSIGTLFASVGITDPLIFAEMVRVANDPRVKIQVNELDISEVRWFLTQFLEDNQGVKIHKEKLIQYLPRLEKATRFIRSGAMERFLDVIRYVASPEAKQLCLQGLEAVNAAIEEKDLNKKVNLVIEAIGAFVTNTRNHPTFILTESAGYFGAEELEEFDQKIQGFEKVRNMFKEHVSLSNRAEWVFERHHKTLLAGIFEGKHLQLLELMHNIRKEGKVGDYADQFRACQGMLLGVSQANSLYLEFSVYQQQKLTLVEAYKEIAQFLQSELLKIFYNAEVQRNAVYLEVSDKFKEILDEFQQTLLQVCSLDTVNE